MGDGHDSPEEFPKRKNQIIYYSIDQIHKFPKEKRKTIAKAIWRK